MKQLKQLKTASYSLRGHESEGGQDSVGVMTTLKHIMGSSPSTSFESAADLKLLVGDDVDLLMKETKEGLLLSDSEFDQGGETVSLVEGIRCISYDHSTY